VPLTNPARGEMFIVNSELPLSNSVGVAINIPLLAEFKANPAVQKIFCTTKLVESYIEQIRVNCGFDQIQCKIKVRTVLDLVFENEKSRHRNLPLNGFSGTHN